MNNIKTETSEIIDGYKLYLEVKYPNHFKQFCSRLKNKPESAKAEAVMFSVLRSLSQDVKIAEDINAGGADFLCIIDNSQFIVEVTCLEAESVAKRSGLKNDIEDGRTTYFTMITNMLRTKASTKTPQLSGKEAPRVLAITTEHIHGSTLMDSLAAKSLLTSGTKISIPIGKPTSKVKLTSDLKDSVFFRSKHGAFESCRRSISAILLVHILSDQCYMVGILHPDPIFVFPIKFFPTVPFIRMRKWPPVNNQIETEWIIHSPKRAQFHYHPVKLKDKELTKQN